MKALSTMFCAICAAFGLTISASAAETIAYWPFGTNGFHDVSGNGHDFTGVEIAESDAGYVSLNQGTTTNQYLKTAAPIDLSGVTAVTIECWCRLTERPAGVYAVLFTTPEPWVGTGGFILYNAGVYQAQMRTSEAGWQLDSSYTNDSDHVSQSLADNNKGFVDGAWHHIAYVIDRSQGNNENSCRLYIDGVRQRNAGRTENAPYAVPNLFNDFFQIGYSQKYVEGMSYFRGYIDDVRISRGVVAPEDFLKYPTVGKAMRADDDRLPVVAYWPFGSNGGKDVTGNGFDLAAVSNVAFKSGYALTTYGTRLSEFNCSVDEAFPFSAFSKIGFTVEMYFKSDSTSTRIGMLMESGVGYWNNPGAFRISFDDKSSGYSTIFSGFHVSGGSGAYSRTSEEAFGDLGDYRWRHLAMVYDPAKQGAGIVTMYIDGIPAACSTEAGNADQKAFALSDLPLYLFRRGNKQIGGSSTEEINAAEVSACPYYGQLDDVRITASVLTPDKFLVDRSPAKKPVALYRFDQSKTDDVTGNGHVLTLVGSPAFANESGTFTGSGTGLKLNGSSQRFYTTDPIDLRHTKAMTIEIDYNRWWSPAGPFAIAGSEDTTLAGGFVVDRSGSNDSYRGLFRAVADSSSWASTLTSGSRGSALDGHYRIRYSIDANTMPANFTLVVDGSITKTGTATTPIDNLGSQRIYFGNSPSYYNSTYFKGMYYRVAISDEALEPADYVLDNLDNDVVPEENRTLAYWDFSNQNGLLVNDCAVRGGALVFNGASSYVTTTNIDLSVLAQATVECFAWFGKNPASGSIFGMGSGAGSFMVASDTTAGTLSGSFVPYDHLATLNGGSTNIASFADRDWHHIALVIDRTQSGADAVKFYVDYQRTMPAGRAWAKTAAMLSDIITIGADAEQTAGFFMGRIDDLRVSAGALAPVEFLHTRTGGPDGTTIVVR